MLMEESGKTKEYLVQLSSSLFNLQRENALCDVVLVSGSMTISCHRIILVATCQYFKNKFSNSQQPEDIIYLPSWFTENGLDAIIVYLYTGSLSFNPSNITLFLEIALYLDIQTAIQLCQKYLQNYCLNVEKVSLNDNSKYDLTYSENVDKLNSSEIDNKSNVKKIHSKLKQKKVKDNTVLEKSLKNKYKTNRKRVNNHPIIKQSLKSYLLSTGDLHSCPLCDKAFRFYYGLNYHQILKHRNMNPTSLSIVCNRYIMPSPTTYIQPTATNKYKCQLCQQLFLYESICTVHIIKHLKLLQKNSFRSYYFIFLKHVIKTRMQNDRLFKKYLFSKKDNKTAELGFKSVFKQNVKQELHMHEHNLKKVYSCNNCDFSTKYEVSLKRHEKLKHMHDFNCILCEKSFKNLNQLHLHQYIAHGIKEESVNRKLIKCPEKNCNYECVSKQRLTSHSIKHTDEKLFTCEMCRKHFKHLIGLEKHKQIIHDGIRPFICEVCGHSFGKESELRLHITRHASSKKYSCDSCSYSTHDKCNLQSHMFRRHKILSNPKMVIFNCPSCSFVTNCRGNFNDHLKKHSKILDVPCSQCGKLFATKKNLYGHITKVHRPKSLHCNFCTYSTSLPTTLRDHVRIMHTQRNIKPFQCPLCAFHSATRGNCRKHIQRLHRDKVTEPRYISHLNASAEVGEEFS